MWNQTTNVPVQTAEEDFILKTTSAEEVGEPELLRCAKLSCSCQVFFARSCQLLPM